jgi:hypothetical protein
MNTEKELKKKTVRIMKSKKAFKAEIEKRFSASEGEKIWKNAHRRLCKMYSEHESLPKGISAHTDSFIFPAAAIYLSMKEKNPDIAYDVMKQVMAIRSEKMGQSLARCCKIPGFRRFFLSMWDTLSHKMFGEASGFKNVFYPKEKDCFRMDITQCPYHKYLTELGCPEINVLFCENDVHMYGKLPGMRFTRTMTIGSGGELCDFKMEIV